MPPFRKVVEAWRQVSVYEKFVSTALTPGASRFPDARFDFFGQTDARRRILGGGGLGLLAGRSAAVWLGRGGGLLRSSRDHCNVVSGSDAGAGMLSMLSRPSARRMKKSWALKRLPSGARTRR